MFVFLHGSDSMPDCFVFLGNFHWTPAVNGPCQFPESRIPRISGKSGNLSGDFGGFQENPRDFREIRKSFRGIRGIPGKFGKVSMESAKFSGFPGFSGGPDAEAREFHDTQNASPLGNQ